MKKRLFYALLICTVIAFSVSAQDQLGSAIESYGVCLDDTYYCNDFFFVAHDMGSNIYEIHGYEYGCGDLSRICSGSIHIAGGYALIGFEKVSNQYDNGLLSYHSIEIDLWSFVGSGCWQHQCESSGSWTTWGGWSDYSMFFCSYPGQTTDAKDVDSSVK